MALKKLSIVLATAALISGCHGKGSCGGAYENADYYTVYFGFDQHHLTSQAMAKLDKQASDIKMNRTSKKVTVEGHADERGTREYNLGLGARRAAAVKEYLKDKGVDGKMIHTVSYGKERPADTGHNEASWAKNRRAVTLHGKDHATMTDTARHNTGAKTKRAFPHS